MALTLSEHPAVCELPEQDRNRVVAHFELVRFPAGERVIAEGETERHLYLILSGSARVTRGDIEVDVLEPGEHFGELALMAARPRAASITAATELEAARLSIDQFETLAAEHPDVALRLVRTLIAGVGEQLSAMTDSVGALLRDRMLPRRARLNVRMGAETREVRAGTLISELLPAEIDGHIVVAGILDRRAVPLATPVTSAAEVAPLTTAHWEGKRIYRNSLALLLLEAARDIDPPVEIHVDYSVGFAQRIKVLGPGSANRAELAQKLQAGMVALAERDLPLRQEWWTVDEAIDHFEAAGARGTVELLRAWRQRAVLVVSLGQTHALFNGPLVPRSGMMSGFRLAADSDGLLLMYGKRGENADRLADLPIVSDARAASRHTREMTREHNRWLDALEISTVGEYNSTCLRGGVSEVIRVAEGFHEKRIGQIADEIRAQAGRIKVVCLSGPSSSGKTTFIKRLKVQLQVNGIRPVSLSLDNYYCDREQTPKDADGRYDYEAFEALRVDLLQDHLHKLLAGETVITARYNFATGISDPVGGSRLTMSDEHILLVEGIHGLNPGLLESLPAERVFRIFTCPLAQLPIDNVSRVHASDLRLLRRIVRDRHHRGTSALDNIQRWPSVRRGERRHIYPFQDNADAVFDSSLIYELSVLKVYAERYLLEVPQTRSEYMTAFRLLKLTDSFVTIYPNHVPPTSMLREFIGGSGFEY